MKKHTAQAVWSGSIQDGQGTMTTGSEVLNKQPYSFKTRFENEKGTNPDELIAAAHASCFAMAFSLLLGKQGFTPDRIDAKAEVTMDTANLKLTESHLTVSAKIPGINEAQFQTIALEAQESCPITKALNLDVRMDATLVI